MISKEEFIKKIQERAERKRKLKWFLRVQNNRKWRIRLKDIPEVEIDVEDDELKISKHD